MGLGAGDQTTIQSISRLDVLSTLAGLRRFTTHERWLGKGNRYAHNTRQVIKDEMGNGGIQNPRHMAQYIAASGLLHCTDGWSYLGKATMSLLKGDLHRARHLAYYAELRAGMSLLANSGIGVFDNKHFVIDAPHRAIALGGGGRTHEFVWDCLDVWAQSNTAVDVFTSMVRPHGHSLDEWLTHLGGGSIIVPQAQAWFKQWGMDIGFYVKDRNARNESSYRPDGLHTSWTVDASLSVQFVKELWTLLEPSATTFETVDRNILRLSLESIFNSHTGKSANEDKTGFKRFALPVVSYQNMPDTVQSNWMKFLTRTTNENDPCIFTYSSQPPEEFGESIFAIMSRASLLLRAATGTNSQLFKDAGINSSSFSFWWKGLGHTRGLWDGIDDKSELIDLWSDIFLSIEELDLFQLNNPPEDQTYYRFANQHGNVFANIGNFELAAIWNATAA